MHKSQETFPRNQLPSETPACAEGTSSLRRRLGEVGRSGGEIQRTRRPKAEALDLRLNEEPIVDSEQIGSGEVLDYGAQDNVVGVEMLKLSPRGNPAEIEKLVFETLTPIF